MGNSKSSFIEPDKLFLKHGIYKGQIQDGVPEGVGSLTKKSGDIYKGTFIGGKLVKGRCVYKNQDFYLGYW